MNTSIKSSLAKSSSAGYSITFRIRIPNKPGGFSRILNVIAEKGASLAEVTLITSDFTHTHRDVTVNCRDEEHSRVVLESVTAVEEIKILAWQDDTLAMHIGGKLSVQPTKKIATVDQLARAYSPGVARVCKAIEANPESMFAYTIKSNTVAVVTDGSAVLGLGNIGPEAALPVMEGKAVLFKQFAGVDAFPICLTTQDTDEIIEIVKAISPVFGGVNLEDISAPRCFEIEEKLQSALDIPIFHDDQHGTAIVAFAGLINSLKVVNKKLSDIKVVINGFGAGGVAITKILLNAGVKNIIGCDSKGVIYRGRKEGMNSIKDQFLGRINLDNVKGVLADALKGADVFIGVSQPDCITRDMVKSMTSNPIIFALANPVPEIYPHEIADLATVVATGRSDYCNQINNVLAFPGIFRGALDCGATRITDKMKEVAAYAIAESIPEDLICSNYIIPGCFQHGIVELVAERVVAIAKQEGVCRKESESMTALKNPHIPLNAGHSIDKEGH
jgi:malate dehydrogenase (oxaloacetate-decarboxylating)